MKRGFAVVLTLIIVLIFPIAFADITSCGSITTSDVLTQDISSTGTCLDIDADDVTIDCQGFSITYASINSGYGINVTGRNNITIQNCNTIQDLSNQTESHGIIFNQTNNSVITNSTAITFEGNPASGSAGIAVFESFNSTIEHSNSTAENYVSIAIALSKDVTVFNTTGTSINLLGVVSFSSEKTIFNRTVGNATNVFGILIVVNNNSIIIDSTGQSVNSAGIAILDSKNTTIENSVGISDSDGGIGSSLSTFSKILNSTGISVSNAGIILSQNEFSLINNSNGTTDSGQGIKVDQTNHSAVVNSAGFGNTGYGVQIINSENITSNNITAESDDSNAFNAETSNLLNLISINATVTNNGVGIRLNTVENSTLSNSRGTANFDNGIAIESGVSVTTTHSVGISTNSPGFLMSSSSYCTLYNVTGIGDASAGLVVNSGIGNIINHSNGTTISGSGLGIVSEDSSLVYNNVGTTEGALGFDIQDSFNLTVVNNTGMDTAGNGGFGVQSTFGSRFDQNSGYGNVVGFFLQFSLNNNLTNTIGVGYQFGIGVVAGTENNTFINSTAYNYAETSTFPFSPGALIFIGFISPVSNNTFINTHVGSNQSNAVVFELDAINNTFINTIIETNRTWIYSDSTSFDNTIENTTFATSSTNVSYSQLLFVPADTNASLDNFNLSQNKVFLNSTELSFLNETAHMIFSNLSSVSDTPLIDQNDDGNFVVCDSSICQNITTGTTFTMDVAHFTTYSSTSGGVNITLEKTDSPDPVIAGNQLNYTLTVTVNDGFAYNITLTEQYPPNVTFDSATPAPDVGDNIWEIGNFSTGESYQINITVNVSDTANGTITNRFNITYQNILNNTFDASVEENTTVIQLQNFGGVSLEIFKSDSPDRVANGSQLNYTISIFVQNGTAFNATLTETYPSLVTFDSSTPAPSIGNNIFDLGNLTNTTFTIDITVNVSSTAPNGAILTNFVILTFENSTGTAFDVNATATTTVTAPTQPTPSGGGGGGGGGSSAAICPAICKQPGNENLPQCNGCITQQPTQTDTFSNFPITEKTIEKESKEIVKPEIRKEPKGFTLKKIVTGKTPTIYFALFVAAAIAVLILLVSLRGRKKHPHFFPKHLR